MAQLKSEYEAMAHRRKLAFLAIAREFGKESPVTKFLGSLAWGRHEWEVGPPGYKLATAAVAAGGLHGYFRALVSAANMFGWPTSRIVQIWTRETSL